MDRRPRYPLPPPRRHRRRSGVALLSRNSRKARIECARPLFELGNASGLPGPGWIRALAEPAHHVEVLRACAPGPILTASAPTKVWQRLTSTRRADLKGPPPIPATFSRCARAAGGSGRGDPRTTTRPRVLSFVARLPSPNVSLAGLSSAFRCDPGYRGLMAAARALLGTINPGSTFQSPVSTSQIGAPTPTRARRAPQAPWPAARQAVASEVVRWAAPERQLQSLRQGADAEGALKALRISRSPGVVRLLFTCPPRRRYRWTFP